MIAKLGIGVVGLGRAFDLMAQTFARDSRVRLVAGADPRREARERFGGTTFESIEELCRAPGVDVVYIATPHQLHAAQAQVAFAAKKHVLVEKPMALTAQDCHAMVDGARQAGVTLIVGHSHSFDLPVLRTRELIHSGKFGPVRMISALNFTDFLRRRQRDAHDTVVHNQAAHQVDIVRVLAGSEVVSVKASVAGASYACQLSFENGAVASLTYGGYGHFNSDEFSGGIGEMGEPGTAHQHFGLVIVSCETADLRPLPTGVMIYDGAKQHLDPLPAPEIPRKEVIDELYAAVAEGKPPLHSGEWGAATMDVVFAMMKP